MLQQRYETRLSPLGGVEENIFKQRGFDPKPSPGQNISRATRGTLLVRQNISIPLHEANQFAIKGFRKTRTYIAKKEPLSRTVEDFWIMIVEQHSTIIVMLAKTIEIGKVYAIRILLRKRCFHFTSRRNFVALVYSERHRLAVFKSDMTVSFA